MDSARTKLIKGAVKSAVAALTGTSTGTSMMAALHAGMDPSQWNVSTLTGIKHNLILSACVIGAAEARYAMQWIQKWYSSDGTLAQALDTAEVAQKQASVAIEEAKSQVPPKP